MLETTKKDIWHLKTEKKPQQNSMRGTVTIKANPIPAGWAAHKLENNYTTEFSDRSENPESRIGFQSGESATGGGASGESGFEAQWGLIAGIPQDCT